MDTIETQNLRLQIEELFPGFLKHAREEEYPLSFRRFGIYGNTSDDALFISMRMVLDTDANNSLAQVTVNTDTIDYLRDLHRTNPEFFFALPPKLFDMESSTFQVIPMAYVNSMKFKFFDDNNDFYERLIKAKTRYNNDRKTPPNTATKDNDNHPQNG